MKVPYELAERANINVKHVSSGEVVLYEDHRTILNVLFYCKKQEPSLFPINVYLFDNHDDACVPSKKVLKMISRYNKKEPSLKDFWSFTDFDLRVLDDDWNKAGMELGLINNVFLFNATKASFDFQQSYKTMSFGTKNLYNLGYIWDALWNRGCLSDLVKSEEYGALWNDFGWVYQRNQGKFFFGPPNAFITDFDLDCFTTEVLDNRIAVPNTILIEKFEEMHQADYHHYYSCKLFVEELIQKSEIITLCFENNFCGGYNQVFEIFKTIDYLFFEEQLGK
ncbi:MAG: hypothetical protein ACJ748_09685 [Flavisolibacter sp.]